MPDILVIQPGFPMEIPFYVRGLAQAGARVLGVGDQSVESLPAVARDNLAAYLRVRDLWDAEALIRALRGWEIPVRLDRVECLWEAAMETAALVREAFGVPGLDVEHTAWFRDKYRMRQRLEQAGIRNLRFGKARTRVELMATADRVGYPLIVKPIAGAGSSDTYRVDCADELVRLLPALSGLDEVVVEEFVTGTEFTFDTLCADGRILFHNILRYTPTMLESRSVEWISPQNMVLRDLSRPEYRAAYRLGEQVLRALEFRSGFTHMEWFLTPRGETVFCEIAARPPGGMTGELMNYCCDFDVYRAWATTILAGRIDQCTERKYNVAMIFKRAIGRGRITHIEGLGELQRRFGPHLVRHDLLPIGAPRRNWKQTLISDGFVILRHPQLDAAERMSAFVAENVRLHAG